MKLERKEESILSWAIVLTVWSHIFSYKANPQFMVEPVRSLSLNDPTSIFATGGFPLHVYDYPMPPMGPGPEQSELPLLVNFIFWLVISYVIARVFPRAADHKKRVGLSVFAAVVSMFVWIGYHLLRFD